MKHIVFAISFLLSLLFTAAPAASGQGLCGDVDENGVVESNDATLLWHYLLQDTIQMDLSVADVDGHPGLTIADVMAIRDNASNQEYVTALSCDSVAEYTYELTDRDTIYLPRFDDVPDSVGAVYGQVFAAFHPEPGYDYYDGFCIPLRRWVADSTFEIMPFWNIPGLTDTVVRTDLNSNEYHFVGETRQRVFTGYLVIQRRKPGTVTIAPEVYDSYRGIRYCTVRFGTPGQTGPASIKVYSPVIAYYSAHRCCNGQQTGEGIAENLMIFDISDLVQMVDHLFVSIQPLECSAMANFNSDPQGSVDIGDLTAIIEYLFNVNGENNIRPFCL